MRDLKHLTGKKRFSLGGFSLKKKQKLTVNSFRIPAVIPSIEEPEQKRRYLRVLLPLVAAVLAAYPVFSLVTSDSPKTSAASKPLIVHDPPGTSRLNPYQAFLLSAQSLKNVPTTGTGPLVAPLSDGGSVQFSLDRELQDRVLEVMAQNRIPYGAFVALEPKTGRVLALAGYSERDRTWSERSCYDLYPMASLFKIITAAAAIEQKKVGPDTVVAYNGRACSENPRYWYAKPGRGNQQMTLTQAMGKSINPVFGRLAGEIVGRDNMMTMSTRFGFNQELFPGTPVTPSRAAEPQNDAQLKLMGAGLGREVKISPLHAAAMMAAIANDGVMMLPVLADRITNGAGDVLYSENSLPVRRLVDHETARQLARTLSMTVSSGTSRKAFHDRKGRPKLADINVAAKTGSINGTDPEGYYTWFAAYAPAENPQIALVALVVNQGKWKIKASQLGEQALEAFFR
jgi:cell division protein FtsI/penicillin-binding protein 2